MIKKSTKAIFKDGDYSGEYDWQGGIPLSADETILVKIESKVMTYRLTEKTTTLDVIGEDQIVETTYSFELLS